MQAESAGKAESTEKGRGGRPELPNPEAHQDASEDGSQFKILGQTMLKMLQVLELLRHHIEGWGSEDDERRRWETVDGSSQQSIGRVSLTMATPLCPWTGAMWRKSIPENVWRKIGGLQSSEDKQASKLRKCLFTLKMPTRKVRFRSSG